MFSLLHRYWRYILFVFFNGVFIAILEAFLLGVLFNALNILRNDSHIVSIFSFQIKSDYFHFWPIFQHVNPLLIVFLFLYLFIQALLQCSKYISALALDYFSSLVKSDSVLYIQDRIFSSDYATSVGFSGGQMSTISLEVPQALCQLITESILLLNTTLLAFAYLAVIIHLSFSLLIIGLLLGLVILRFQSFVSRKTRIYSNRILKSQGIVNDLISDDLRAIKLLKVLQIFRYSEMRLASEVKELQKRIVLNSLFSQSSQPLSQLLSAGSLVVLILSATLLFNNQSESGIALAATYVVAFQRFAGSMTSAGQNFNSISQVLGKLDLFNEFLGLTCSSDYEIKNSSTQNIILPPIILVLSSVTYKYPRSEYTSCNNITLSLTTGQTVAFVGPSGSGKTTVVDLMSGLLRPTSGSISVYDSNDTKLSDKSLASIIGYVSQEPYIIRASIKDNILMGRTLSNLDHLGQILDGLGLEPLLKRLPNGINTVIGEGGHRLSGGQYQRISLARALYSSPKILILDEYTSNLDNISQSLIHSYLQATKYQRITVIIAHRLSTCLDCDQIFVFESGNIAQVGTHDHLIADHNGLYSRLWNR